MRFKITSVFVDDNGERFFGEGPYRLLLGIEKKGSLRAAAADMGMAYAKAFAILKRAEEQFGRPLTQRHIGGKSGGGSTLTPWGRSLVQRYGSCKEQLELQAQQLLRQQFPELCRPVTGAVIMAAGGSRRFGGNKLLHPFCGRPMAEYAAGLLPGECMANTVAVVSDREVEAVFERCGVPTLFYRGGEQSDTVKLGLGRLLHTDGCVFIPADQPRLTPQSLKKLLEAFCSEPEVVWRLAWGEREGAPVVLPKSLYRRVMELKGDVGGMAAVRGSGIEIKTVQASSPQELMDADTPEELEKLV